MQGEKAMREGNGYQVFFIRIIFLSVAILPLFTSQAHAYIDPGTGTLILQAILAAIAGVVAYVTMAFTKVRNFASRLLSRKSKENDKMEEDNN